MFYPFLTSISLRVSKHNSDDTAAPTCQNSISSIGQHLLANQDSARVYSPDKFTILETETKEQQLSILEALLIKKCKLEAIFHGFAMPLKRPNQTKPNLTDESNFSIN